MRPAAPHHMDGAQCTTTGKPHTHGRFPNVTYVLVLLACLLLAGCAPPPGTTAPSTPPMAQQPACYGLFCGVTQRQMAYGVGVDVQTLIGAWGPPTYVYNNPDGTSMGISQSTAYWWNGYGAAPIERTRMFFIGRDGRVTRFTWTNC